MFASHLLDNPSNYQTHLWFKPFEASHHGRWPTGSNSQTLECHS